MSQSPVAVTGPTDGSWDVRRRAAVLRRVILFAALPEPTIGELAARFTIRRVPRAGFVFLEGQPTGTLHVAAEGRIKIVRERGGRQVILRVIRPSEAFGVSGGWGAPRTQRRPRRWIARWSCACRHVPLPPSLLHTLIWHSH